MTSTLLGSVAINKDEFPYIEQYFVQVTLDYHVLGEVEGVETLEAPGSEEPHPVSFSFPSDVVDDGASKLSRGTLVDALVGTMVHKRSRINRISSRQFPEFPG